MFKFHFLIDNLADPDPTSQLTILPVENDFVESGDENYGNLLCTKLRFFFIHILFSVINLQQIPKFPAGKQRHSLPYFRVQQFRELQHPMLICEILVGITFEPLRPMPKVPHPSYASAGKVICCYIV